MHWFTKYRTISAWVSRHTQRVAQHERSLLARDLHDGLGQDLYAANLVLSSLRGSVPPDVVPKVDALIDRHVHMIDDMRRLVAERRHPSARAVTLDHFLGQLTDLTWRELDRLPMTQVETSAPALVPSRLLIEVTYALREMISNAVRHSGASMIVVMLDLDEHEVSVCVADDGVGAQPGDSQGDGLRNLRARAQHCAGRFTWRSTADVGTTARWVAPWDCGRQSPMAALLGSAR